MYLALLLACSACERIEPDLAPPPATEPTVSPPAPLAQLAQPAPPPAPEPPPPPAPKRIVTPDGADLPDPPSAEPHAYDAWLASLAPATRTRVRALCRTHPVDFEAPCAGIGPLHIPVSPRVARFTSDTGPTHEQWDAALTKAQSAYVARHCVSHGEMGGTDSDLCQFGTPLLVTFEADATLRYTYDTRFAFTAGAPVAVDWPTSDTPWIALDRDADGAITSAAELFGDATGARDGFAALAELDTNHDGVLDARDPAFAHLVLWADRDRDGRGTADELSPLAERIDAIALAPNEHGRAAMRWHDAHGSHAGAVIDVYLRAR